MLAETFASSPARGGGFELPDNGTEAMGRGAAFVAKASDGTAIQHNPAGLARQRGTHVLVDGNLYLHSFEFQRSGSYGDDPNDPETPWGNVPFPLVKNVGGPSFLPFVAVTTDFGAFDRFTLAAGVFGPPTVGNRTFPAGVERKPSPARYDFVQARSLLLYPTASAGLRVTRWLDLGVSAHLLLARLDQTSVSYVDVGRGACKKAEYFPCDSRSSLETTAASFGATIGAMARPSPHVAIGASFRTPINVTARGAITPQTPTVMENSELDPSTVTLATQLPWLLRVGGRYVGMDAEFELYDLELDVTYEAWGSSQAFGPIVTVPDVGAYKDIQAVVAHGYEDTVGLRAGGAYNIDVGGAVVSLRGGAYFDSSATKPATTRLDFDTLAKVAGTFGLGYGVGAFRLDVGYAAVASVPRVVGKDAGAIRPSNWAKGGDPVGADDLPLPAINEGAYRGFTHVVSVGLGLSIDASFGPARPIHYGNAYEPNYVGPR